MSIAPVMTGVPVGLAGWKMLQDRTPTDFQAFSRDPTLQNDIAYLRTNLPTKLTAQSLLDDRRLQEIVLKAYGLDAQIGFNGLMKQVLESDPADSSSAAARMTDARFRQIATDLNYGASTTAAVPATPSRAEVQISFDGGAGFTSFSGSFGTVQVEDVPLSGLNSRAEVAAALQRAFRRADGGRSDISVTTFGLNLVITDAKGRGNIGYDFAAAEGSKANATVETGGVLPLTGRVSLSGLAGDQGFDSFSGTFGTVSVSDVSLKGLSSAQGVASALQAAFRKADGGRSDIGVAVQGDTLVFTDARNRNAAQFSFSGGASATLVKNANGTVGTEAEGGAAVADNTLIESIVQKYTQAQFEESLGNTSESLRRAVYARRALPQVTSWYNVIADRNLASVVQTVLGLPDSFGQLDVDKQYETLSRRMDIADFKDSTKLSSLLERYVAQTSVAEAQALSSSSGIVSLVQPIAWGGDSFSGASSAALFSILANQ